MKNFVPYQYSLVIEEPLYLLQIKLYDFKLSIPQSKIDIIQQSLSDQPNDDKAIEMWIEEQRILQWNLFKENCSRAARQELNITRSLASGVFSLKTVHKPKPIKPYYPL